MKRPILMTVLAMILALGSSQAWGGGCKGCAPQAVATIPYGGGCASCTQGLALSPWEQVQVVHWI